MDSLQALRDKLKKNVREVSEGGKKFVSRAELEAAKLLKLRAEEEEERKQKELKRKTHDIAMEDASAAKAPKLNAAAEHEMLLPSLSKDEVIRRLRALGQPSTLFGEEDVDRLRRLLRAEKEVTVEDENRGGQQGNLLLELQKTEKERAKMKIKEAVISKAVDEAAAAKAEAGQAARVAAAAAAGASSGSSAAATAAMAAAGTSATGASTGSQAAAAGLKKDSRPAAGCEAPLVELDAKQLEAEAMMEIFKKGAALVAEKRAEESMCTEDRISKSLKRWMKEWEEDLDSRPDAIKATASGYQASMTFAQTQKYLEPLFDRLKHRALHEELRAGLWMMVTAMRERNYLYANDLYLRLAIGNAPWPIGVTSVGIHERSAREKISHVMNSSGQAHIMNDEATRKYLQAMKRLISAVQRMYPTDPSRSADFETTTDMGRGMAGAGSTKLALLQAEARGETTEALGLPAAPHYMRDNKVMVPPKWQHILAKGKDSIVEDKHAKDGADPSNQ